MMPKRLLYGLAALAIIPVLMAWTSVSLFLGRSKPVAAIVSILAIVGVAVVCALQDNLVVYDIPAVATATILLLTLIPRKLLVVHVSLVVGFLSYAITHRRYSTLGPSSALDNLVLLSSIAIAWTFISAQSLWIRANSDALVQAERVLYKTAIQPIHHLLVVAGMGTVHVPYAGKDTSKKPLTVVLIHGYAAGNGFWALTLNHLAEHFNVYAVEWLGIGRSDRPSVAFKSYDEADAFFVESLERWRQELKLDSMVLCGHSMGGMFATHYSLKYPKHVQQLVLVSPCGLPEVESPVHWLFDLIWSLEITPMDLVRLAGPFGRRFVCFILTARLSRQPESNAIKMGHLPMDVMVQYVYNNWAQKKSGERAYAKRPLKHMLVPDKVKMPISFIYGEDGNDWMNSAHAAKIIPGLPQHTVLHKITSAGHQVFMDNPQEFNERMVESILAAAAVAN
ncbi:hypothetical protein AeMF1_013541 [Aphanomyces euteiches]|nr:hypothetical protein AeMF1_013541 [Aphanomyces euteiches]KAH9190116.1 hypothetical protein AeNC1_007907 [Aphanomyces euteiches]